MFHWRLLLIIKYIKYVVSRDFLLFIALYTVRPIHYMVSLQWETGKVTMVICTGHLYWRKITLNIEIWPVVSAQTPGCLHLLREVLLLGRRAIP